MNTRTEVPDGTLGPYVENQISTYAAAAISETDFQQTFTIGDGQTYSLNGMEFVNSPLRANQAYVFFIRLYSSDPVSYMYNKEIGREVGREGRRREGGEREGKFPLHDMLVCEIKIRAVLCQWRPLISKFSSQGNVWL